MNADQYTRLPAETVFPTGGTIACQGVRGAYSSLAAQKMFPNGTCLVFKTFEAVAEAVLSGMCSFGILPIENNTFGSVRNVYRILQEGKVHIVRSETLLIRHCLLAKPGTVLKDIRRLYSHEQAFGQCQSFLRSLGDSVTAFPCLNTAVGARTAAEDPSPDAAAVASPECAGIYGLEVLKDNIADSDNNHTRFICISRDAVIYPGSGKISLILSTRHVPGALYEILGEFAALKLNLLKLESAPVPGKDFEFIFYIDIEASAADPAVLAMLSKLSEICPDYVFLGNYQEV